MNGHIEEYFKEMLGKITPSDSERKAAIESANSIASVIGQGVRINRSLIVGSVSRCTDIRIYSDVDILVCVDDEKSAKQRRPPESLMASVLAILAASGTDAFISDNTTHVNLSTGPGVDVLVALRTIKNSHQEQIYMIPSQDRREWQPYAPEKLNHLVRDQGLRLGRDIERLIRLMKWWNYSNACRIPSYKIEIAICSLFDQVMPELPQAILKFYDSAIDDMDSLSQPKIRAARNLAQAALDRVSNGRPIDAILLWRRLLNG